MALVLNNLKRVDMPLNKETKPTKPWQWNSRLNWDSICHAWKIKVPKVIYAFLINGFTSTKFDLALLQFVNMQGRGQWPLLANQMPGCVTDYYSSSYSSRAITFTFGQIPLGKVWTPLFSLQLWVNSRTD